MSLLTPRTVATTLDTMRTFRGMIMESRPVKLMLRGASVYRWHSMSGFMIMMHASCAVGVDRCRHEEVRRILALGMAIMHPTTDHLLNWMRYRSKDGLQATSQALISTISTSLKLGVVIAVGVRISILKIHELFHRRVDGEFVFMTISFFKFRQ